MTSYIKNRHLFQSPFLYTSKINAAIPIEGISSDTKDSAEACCYSINKISNIKKSPNPPTCISVTMYFQPVKPAHAAIAKGHMKRYLHI